MAQTLRSRIRERVSYAVSTLRTRSAARCDVLALRARLDRTGSDIRAATNALGEATLRDDYEAVEELRTRIARLEEEAARDRARIEHVLRWATGAVERERLAVQETRIGHSE